MPDRDLQHPVITAMERTGHPDGKEPEHPQCPFCGSVCDTMYKDRFGYYTGCENCMESRDAWEADCCFPEKEDI